MEGVSVSHTHTHTQRRIYPIAHLHVHRSHMPNNAFAMLCLLAILSRTLAVPERIKTIHIAQETSDVGIVQPVVSVSSKVLFSMTTTLHVPQKEHFVRTALESFTQHHPDQAAFIDRWLVINEYSDDVNAPTASHAIARLQQEFPHLEFYQKSAAEQGQARSLNMILDVLRAGGYRYWLHVEESWQTIRPFLGEAVQALDEHAYLQQLQLYNAPYYLNHARTRITENLEVVALDSSVDLTHASPHDWRTYNYKWPSYSLRPSLTRASFLRDHPKLTFDTHAANFPVAFEFEFAVKWHLLGGSMCALMPEAIVRQEGHQSSYTLSA